MKRPVKCWGVIIAVIFCMTLTEFRVLAQTKITLNVFSWGEYIDHSVITDFEAKYPNIKVNYETFDSNEAMYTKLTTKDAYYDVIIPSDYMLEKLISKNLLYTLDYTKIPNYVDVDISLTAKLDCEFKEDVNKPVDINKYGVPYFWGTVGILYDKTKVDKTVDSWNILWDKDYKKQIYMYDSQRDSLMVALRILGYSANTTNIDELEEAKALLIKQKPLVYAYVTDSVIQGMIDSNAALAMVYSGDAAFIMSENENMEYVIPKEGTNLWVDLMAIPKTSKNINEAHLYINYMCERSAARKNTDEVMYSSPIRPVFDEVILEEWADNIAYNPTNLDAFGGTISTEIFRDPGTFIKHYDKIWSEVMAPETNYLIFIIIGGVVIIGIGTYYFLSRKRKGSY